MEYKKHLEDLLATVIKEGGSDIHLSEGRHPTIRVSGVLIPLLKQPILSKEDTRGILNEMLDVENKERFFKTKEIDFSYNHQGGDRFRGNAFFQQGTISIALRLISKKIRTLEELGLPPILATFA